MLMVMKVVLATHSLAARGGCLFRGCLVACPGRASESSQGAAAIWRVDRRLAGVSQVAVGYLVAAWYCPATLAGMRPRSLTGMPWAFAHAGCRRCAG